MRLEAAKLFYYSPLSFAYAQQLRPHKWWRLLVQYKHGVQCRTPRGAIVSMGLRGVQGGLRGEIEIFPGPPAKKVIKKLAVLFVCFNPSDNPPYGVLPAPRPGSHLVRFTSSQISLPP